MNSLPTRAIFGGASVLMAAVSISGLLSSGAAMAVVSMIFAAGIGCVAFAAQSRRLRDEDRLVYRPVYARRQAVQRRVRSDD